jgi:hypothetical protein
MLRKVAKRFKIARRVREIAFRTARRSSGTLILPILICLCGCANVRLERRGVPQQRVVSRTYSVDLSTLRKGIVDNFSGVLNTATMPIRSMHVIELKPPNYPPDWLVTWTDPGNFLDPYKGISAAQRDQDLLIEEPTGDLYWRSEYETATGPAKFRCGFIIHFEQQRPLSTEVQVYEKVPEVWVGERWDFLREGIGFGRVHDIRMVEPTVKDRVDLLNTLNEIALTRSIQ